jgi:catechol 2,3-dioxygenase-like lactoylglutathione lyase family enzyme
MTAIEPSPVYFANQPLDLRFHFSLNVENIENSTDFFAKLFGSPPAKQRDHYAKFECDDPRLVLSLEQNSRSQFGSLNHVGFRVPDSETLVAIQQRLEAAGVITTREDGVECCYAKQSKFWVHDPDGNMWEVYTLEEDIDHRGYADQTTSPVAEPECRVPKVSIAKSTWTHRIGQTWPKQLFVLPRSVDQIVLEGTFNQQSTQTERSQLLAKLTRALQATGEVHIHALVADRSLDTIAIQLPGPASVVQQVPAIESVMAELEEAGFTSIEITKLSHQPVFVVANIGLRELQLIARLSTSETSDDSIEAIYIGPGMELKLADGSVLRKGRSSRVSQAALIQAKLPDDHIVVIGT